jgi:hypothetical protein
LTIWIFEITGAVSQLQVTFPRAMIWDVVGVTLEQTVKGTDVIVHEPLKHTLPFAAKAQLGQDTKYG